MKKIFITLMAITPLLASAGMRVTQHLPAGPSAADIQRARENEELKAEAIKKHAAQKEGFERDPFRQFGDKVFKTDGTWMVFRGKVLQVHPDGVRLDGEYYQYNDPQHNHYEGEFLIANLPYVVAEGDYFGRGYFFAREDGTYTYTTVLKASRTIRKLDYGTVWTPPPPSEEAIAAAKAAAEKAAAERKAKAEAATLKFHEQLAAKGDAYGQLRMGQRYLAGDGVPQDETKGRALLEKSAAQGNAEAKALLKK